MLILLHHRIQPKSCAMDNTQDFVHEIFVARCKDIGERPRKEDAAEFSNTFSNTCYWVGEDNYVIALRDARIGPNAAIAISKMLKNISKVTTVDLYGNGKGFILWCMLNSHSYSKCWSSSTCRCS